jgi:hypothetical protein
VPAVLTVILVALTPVLHFTVLLHPLAVKVAVSLLHKLVLLATIVGAVGVLPVVITIGVEISLVPQVVVHVAV